VFEADEEVDEEANVVLGDGVTVDGASEVVAVLVVARLEVEVEDMSAALLVRRWITKPVLAELGSASDHCIHHCPIVTVIHSACSGSVSSRRVSTDSKIPQYNANSHSYEPCLVPY
jgi:hypothetical protein